MLTDTFIGKVEGEAFNDTFKNKITAYLENPDADQTNPTIRSQVGYDKFFRVIAYKETGYKHFYPSIYGEPKKAIYPRENSGGDGGFGVMQLTDPIPTYAQIWNGKKNVDGGVELIRGKLKEAKDYPAFVRTTGCNLPPAYNSDGSIRYYRCRPQQPRDSQAADFGPYQLKMETYSLYNSGWHYWKWVVIDKKKGINGWQSRQPRGNAPEGTGSYYADDADDIETKVKNDALVKSRHHLTT